MQKKIMRGAFLTIAALFALALAPAPFVSAHNGVDDEEDTTSESNESSDQKESMQVRLTAVKLKVCEKRKTRIDAIIARAERRAENQLKVFTTISERVQAFYTKKGKTLSNYDELVTAVNDAKAKAETDLATLQNSDTFACDSEDPKASIEDFKTKLKMVNQDLKDYRTSIKNLIVGVKSVQSTVNKDTSEGGGEQ